MNMREQFEAWAEKELLPLDRRDSDHYRYNLTNRAWAGWQAALASQAAELSSNPLQLPSQAQQTESKWLPMETAPKDKTKILIKFIKYEAASSEVVDAWFEDGWQRIDYGRNTYVCLVNCELLGWMPLPPAPEGDKK